MSNAPLPFALRQLPLKWAWEWVSPGQAAEEGWGVLCWRLLSCSKTGSELASNLWQLSPLAQPLQIQRPFTSPGTVPHSPWVFRILSHFTYWACSPFLHCWSGSWRVKGWWLFAYMRGVLSLTSWLLFSSAQQVAAPSPCVTPASPLLPQQFSQDSEAQPPSHTKVSSALLLSCVWLFAIPMDLRPTGLLCPWKFPGKNTGVGCHFLLQGIFLTQGLNPHLLHWQADSLPLCHLGSHVMVSNMLNKDAKMN